jgi:hypothetical protein
MSMKLVECFVLVYAAKNGGIVGAKARIPIHGVVGNTSLVVGGASSASDEGDSELIPGARPSTCVVSVEPGLPVYGSAVTQWL